MLQPGPGPFSGETAFGGCGSALGTTGPAGKTLVIKASIRVREAVAGYHGTAGAAVHPVGRSIATGVPLAYPPGCTECGLGS